MNQCHFIGNLVRDPEVFQFENSGTKKVSFRIAVDRSFKNKTTGKWESKAVFLDFVAWDTAADLIGERFKKGDAIIIEEAAADNEEWEKDGQKRSKVIFRVNKFAFPRFGGGKKNNDEAAAPAPAETAAPAKASKGKARKQEEEEEEIPF